METDFVVAYGENVRGPSPQRSAIKAAVWFFEAGRDAVYVSCGF